MNKITCGTTLRNYGWQEGWYVEDGDNTAFKPNIDAKKAWIESQNLKSQVIETMGGWAFRDKQTASLFVLTWS